MFSHLYVQADALFWLCLVAKFCKIWQQKMHVVKTGKYSPVKFCKFCMFVLRAEKLTICAPNVEDFSAHDTNISKIRKLRRDVFSGNYSISQPNFCSFTDFKVLFLAVVNDFVRILPKSKFTFSWEQRVYDNKDLISTNPCMLYLF